MKKILLSFLLLFSVTLFSQDKIITSEEEYKFLTKGYQIYLENGSDFKAGYELVKLTENNTDGYTITYHKFNDTNIKKTKALLIIIEKKKDKYYLCLPFNNNDLLKKYILEHKIV
uniref:hypothetical protein n=1 Tax=Flavobacterium sp. TaxID=239 RepID=UPI004048A3AB